MNQIPSVSDVKNFVQGNINYALQRNLPTHQLEQVELRKFLCQPCLLNGSCLSCGCKTPHVFYSPSKHDAQDKWGPFMSEIQWNSLKNNIDRYAEYIKILRSESGSSSISSTTTQDVNKVSK